MLVSRLHMQARYASGNIPQKYIWVTRTVPVDQRTVIKAHGVLNDQQLYACKPRFYLVWLDTVTDNLELTIQHYKCITVAVYFSFWLFLYETDVFGSSSSPHTIEITQQFTMKTKWKIKQDCKFFRR